MIVETFPIRQHGVLTRFGHSESPETPYRAKRPAVVVCPGGGYSFLSDREADPVAFQFLAAGYQAFVLRYSIGQHAAFPNSLLDLCEAVKWIREHADEFGVIPDQIAICGFSAGGHLAASLGVYWNDPQIMEKSGCFHGENRPNALILGYPVISTSWIQDNQALPMLTGEADPEEIYQKLNLHTAVTAFCPQSFLMHTVRDNAVPVEDSIRFASALIEAGVPCEMHIFPNGYHGLSLANDQVCIDGGDADFAKWVDLAICWLTRLFTNKDEAAAPLQKAPYSARL